MGKTRYFYDFEQGKYFTIDDIKAEYNTLIEDEFFAEDYPHFADYLNACHISENGTLKEVHFLIESTSERAMGNAYFDGEKILLCDGGIMQIMQALREIEKDFDEYRNIHNYEADRLQREGYPVYSCVRI